MPLSSARVALLAVFLFTSGLSFSVQREYPYALFVQVRVRSELLRSASYPYTQLFSLHVRSDILRSTRVSLPAVFQFTSGPNICAQRDRPYTLFFAFTWDLSFFVQRDNPYRLFVQFTSGLSFVYQRECPYNLVVQLHVRSELLRSARSSLQAVLFNSRQIWATPFNESVLTSCFPVHVRSEHLCWAWFILTRCCLFKFTSGLSFVDQRDNTYELYSGFTSDLSICVQRDYPYSLFSPSRQVWASTFIEIILTICLFKFMSVRYHRILVINSLVTAIHEHFALAHIFGVQNILSLPVVTISVSVRDESRGLCWAVTILLPAPLSHAWTRMRNGTLGSADEHGSYRTHELLASGQFAAAAGPKRWTNNWIVCTPGGTGCSPRRMAAPRATSASSWINNNKVSDIFTVGIISYSLWVSAERPKRYDSVDLLSFYLRSYLGLRERAPWY